MFNSLFCEYLLLKNIIDKESFDKVLATCEKNKTIAYEEIINLQVLTEEKCYQLLAEYLGYPLKEMQLTELDLNLVKKYPREKLIMAKALPYRETNNYVRFVLSNPLHLEDIEEFKYTNKKKISYELVLPSTMEKLINYLNNRIKQLNVLQDYNDNVIDDVTDIDTEGEGDAPIITLCDSILRDAVSRKASDIHIEPFENEVIVRYRIDGKLQVNDRIKPHLFQPLLARFKIMAELNIAERRIPQDGKINLNIDNGEYDFRVSTMPTIHGEKIVIRIYNKTLNTSEMSALGLSQWQTEIIKSTITRPHGIILLTGPTGSGKSTSLYTFLRFLNREDTNIITVEDPVENQIDGITQVQVNNKANLTFSNVLRAILRQDPNIIMIGEIRDEETAQIAVRAAITGHLVLSTIHTNSAAGVVSRLIDMGVAPYLVADSLLCSISQRLVRKLCPHCKKEHITTSSEMQMLNLSSQTTIYQAHGCPVCNNTGYAGRVGVFEILPVDSRVRSIIMDENFTSEMLQSAIAETIPTINDNARERVLNGDTSIEEYESLLENLYNGLKVGENVI